MKKILILIILLIPVNVIAFTDTSKSSIVMDIDTGRILYQKNSNEKSLIASTTKIMTFLTVIELMNNQLDTDVQVGLEVLKMYGTNMYLSVKEELKIKDLLYGLMLRSGNDASVVLATSISGSIDNFVNTMNIIAKRIGMNYTTYKNPHGLDEETKNYSTAYDLAILTRYLYLNYPIYKEISGSKYYNFKSNLKSYELINRSKILFDYQYITSTKTGYTPLAGKSLVTTATKNNLNLLIVSIDDKNHYENQKNMYEYFFNNYVNYKVIDKNNFNISSNIINEDYYIKNDYYYPVLKNEIPKIETKIIIGNKDKKALGTIQVIFNNNVIHEEKIYKKIETKKDTLFKRIIKFIKSLFNL